MATLQALNLLDQLRGQLNGSVITPEDVLYDNARQAWNLTVDQRPAVIVLADNAADVVQAVRFARHVGLGIAVQSTGHGVVLPANDSVLIITSRMNKVQVNAEKQTALVEAGAVWDMVLQPAQAVGLAPLLGSSPYVGVVGYTLGGGLGWLARQYGLAADSTVAFELVTAAGDLIRASADENPDLFWGLRGGGGSFGVITGLEIRLYPVMQVYAGNLLYPIEQSKEVMTRYRNWIAHLPNEMTTSIVLMNFPPVPGVPEFLQGRSAVIVRGCYNGPAEKGEALMTYWRDWMTPMADMFHAMPFSAAETISNDPKDSVPGYGSGGWMSDLSDEAIDTLIRYGTPADPNAGPAPLVFVEVRHIGGAVADADPTASAFTHRYAPLLLNFIGIAPTPDAYQRVAEHGKQFKRALAPSLTGGVYMNFAEGGEARAHTKDGFSRESYQRLMALKAKFDPDNVFRYGFDIPPAR
jgi:FAD/FMN-containing dehydrogenase